MGNLLSSVVFPPTTWKVLRARRGWFYQLRAPGSSCAAYSPEAKSQAGSSVGGTCSVVLYDFEQGGGWLALSLRFLLSVTWGGGVYLFFWRTDDRGPLPGGYLNSAEWAGIANDLEMILQVSRLGDVKHTSELSRALMSPGRKRGTWEDGCVKVVSDIVAELSHLSVHSCGRTAWKWLARKMGEGTQQCWLAERTSMTWEAKLLVS